MRGKLVDQDRFDYYDGPLTEYPWSVMNSEAKDLRDELLQNWQSMLGANLPEEAYQSFLALNAGFFFLNATNRFICIQKLRLGAEYVVDFVVAHDRHSDGPVWELVEIELPSSQPFTRDGVQSARLSRAIQQVKNWERWIHDNRRDVEKLLPARGVRTKRDPTIIFSIVIGTRRGTSEWLDERETLARERGINIISFDRLTDWARSRSCTDSTWIFSSEENSMPSVVRNQLANPFAAAFSDAQWRTAVREVRAPYHLVASVAIGLLRHRPTNEVRFQEFISKL